MTEALNRNSAAMVTAAEAVEASTTATAAHNGLAAARAAAFDTFVSDFKDHARRVLDALQQRAVR